MASELLLEFGREFEGKDWYKHSLSEILNNLARNLRYGLASDLRNAAINVWCHEYRINSYLKTTPAGEPVHHDLGFVRDGYKHALKDLIALITGKVAGLWRF